MSPVHVPFGIILFCHKEANTRKKVLISITHFQLRMETGGRATSARIVEAFSKLSLTAASFPIWRARLSPFFGREGRKGAGTRSQSRGS